MLLDIYILWMLLYIIHYKRIKFQSCLCVTLSLSLPLWSLYCYKNVLFLLDFPRNEEQKITFSSVFLSMLVNVCVCVSSSDICISINFRINEIQFDIIFLSLIKNSNSLSKAYITPRMPEGDWEREREMESMSKGDWKWSWTWTFLNLYTIHRPEMCNECANSTMRKPN